MDLYSELEDFEYSIEHRSAPGMKHVDLLSKNPVIILYEDVTMLARNVNTQETDEQLKPIFEKLRDRADEEYLLKNGILYRYQDGIELLVLPKGLQNVIIWNNNNNNAHEIGHFCVRKTKKIFKEEILNQRPCYA